MSFDQSSLFDISHLVTFVGGALVGCAGQYFADRFTDQRRKQESKSAASKQFDELKSAMPDLFAEMLKDLDDDESRSIREFVVMPNKRVSFNSCKPRFSYFEDEHPNLRVQVDRLHYAGYLDDVTVGHAPIYRMREQFIVLLKERA